MPLAQTDLRYCSEHKILSTCPCTNWDCNRRGICCECVANHKDHGILNACGRIMAAPLFEKMKGLSPDSEAVQYLQNFLGLLEKSGRSHVEKKAEKTRANDEKRHQHFTEVMDKLQKTADGLDIKISHCQLGCF